MNMGSMKSLLEKYSFTMWQDTVAKGETVLGYLQWVEAKQMSEQFESEIDCLERLAHNGRASWKKRF